MPYSPRAVSIALGWILLAVSAAAGRQPNVIVIIADDMGYADIGVNGCQDIPTPHIDSLAQNGVRCSNGYVSHPYCSPTRAGLMTGRYQQRFGHEFNPGPPTDRTPGIGLPLREITFADRMKAAGYKTGIVGKWHLGHTDDEFHPLNLGSRSSSDSSADPIVTCDPEPGTPPFSAAGRRCRKRSI